MDVPGGVVDRPLVKIYDPTFWAASSFVHVRDFQNGQGMAVFPGGPASISGNSLGTLEWIALRNTPREQAFGFLPLLGHPAKAHDPDEHTLDYAVGFTNSGDWRENKLHLFTRDAQADPLFRTDNEDVVVMALKPAESGQGVIVRLFSYGFYSGSVKLECAGRPIKRAVVCDAQEREDEPIAVEEGKAVVPLSGAIATVKILS